MTTQLTQRPNKPPLPRAAPGDFDAAQAANRRPALCDRTDEDLACRAQAGSVPAFVELVRRWESRLFNFVLHRSAAAALSRADAEDITQEALVRGWQRIGEFRPGPRRRFSTWLFTIASRLAVDHLRQRRMVEKHRTGVGHHAQQLNAAETTTAGPSSAPLWALARDVLSDNQHAALWLRYAEDLDVAEIARVLGKTQIGVRVLLHRARTSLKRAADATLSDDFSIIAKEPGETP